MASSTTTTMDLSSVNSLQAGVAVSLLAVGGGILYSWLQRNRDNELSTNNAPPVPTTNSNDDSKERVVLVVGGGTIGSSFAAVFLSRGLKVHVMDPFATKETVQERIKMVWPTILARGITKLQEAPIDTALSQSDSLTAAVDAIQKQGQTIDFVQECTWEDVDNKQKILQELDHLVDPSVIIASSTSFIPWTLLVTQCTHKHRILIGHPAIPHLSSFMEIYGIAPDWVARCKEWYAKAAFGVIVMKKTIPGHVFNSFLRINLVHGDKLVRNGICSPEDVNQAMRSLGRSFYAGHGFLMTLILIGGDRGMKGGDELVERIKKDAIFLTLFSGMKQNTPLPDCITRSAARLLGRILEGILPDQALETKQVTEQIERAITEDGKIPIQQALLEKSRQIYELTPMEVDNDPFAMTALMK